MKRAHRLHSKVQWRRAGAGAMLLAGSLAALGAGCSAPQRLEVSALKPAPSGNLVRLQDEVPTLPMPQSAAPAAPAAVAPAKVLPIGLDTVLRLAEQQNNQIGVARAKVNEALAERDLAGKRWLPDLYVGTAFYRHEGGIQNEDGTAIRSSSQALFPGMEVHGLWDVREIAFRQINAERNAWQQKGELSRISSETLLDAASTYIDLLTARTGEAIAQEQKKALDELLSRAQKLASVEKAARVEVLRVESEMAAQEQAILRLRQQASGATAKLVYLLGLDPCTELQPIDQRVAPFQLVDANPPVCDLVEQSFRSGPGVRELEGLLALINEGIERSQGPLRWLPTFEMRMAEGPFGAAPGSSLDWNNRWDLALQMRWNITEYATVKERRRAAEAKMMQAQLAYGELRGKLTAGIHESREAIHSGREQLTFAEKQVAQAQEAFRHSHDRLFNTPASRENPLGGTYSEALMSLRLVSLAQLNYLTVVREFDRAQLRMMVLLGKVEAP